MHIPFSDKNAERIRTAKTRHQMRREQRMKEETAREFDDKFGGRKEFGQRAMASKKAAKPKRSFGFLKKD